MAESNFKVFNEEMSSDRTFSDAEYSVATQRQGGVIPGMALSRLHNKLYRQSTAMAKAIADFIVAQGYDCKDDDIPGITTALQAAMLAIAEDAVDTHSTAAVLDHPDNSVTDAKIGNRTITDTTTAAAAANTLTNLLGMVGYMLKSITGKSNWNTLPATTIQAISDLIVTTAAANKLLKLDASGKLPADITGNATTATTANTATNATNHISAASGAHAASAITFTPTGGITEVTTQAAVAGVDTRKLSKDYAPATGVRVMRDLAQYVNNSIATGTIKITIPIMTAISFFDIDIVGFNRYYSGSGYKSAWKLRISGQFSTDGTVFNATDVLLSPNAPFTSVRCGTDGTNLCILLGTTSTAWDYPAINLERFQSSHTGYAALANNFSISLITAETGYTVTSPIIKTLATLESPPLTGTPTAPTAAAGTSTTQLATTAFVQAAINALGGGVIAYSLAENGYVKFANGLILQWGNVVHTIQSRLGTDALSITFPISFTSVFGFIADSSRYSVADGHIYGLQHGSLTTTGAKLQIDQFNTNGAGQSATFYWCAVGM